jgi:hypothetical protein
MKNTPAIHPQLTDVPCTNISLHAETLPVVARDASTFDGLYLTGKFQKLHLVFPLGLLL